MKVTNELLEKVSIALGGRVMGGVRYHPCIACDLQCCRRCRFNERNTDEQCDSASVRKAGDIYLAFDVSQSLHPRHRIQPMSAVWKSELRDRHREYGDYAP
jgi:hypothetical protein